jgi:hypothetical protein
MKVVNFDEWYSEVTDQEKLKKLEEHFGFVCKKCNGNQVTLERYDDMGMGSEYTGAWGDAGAILKCRECGNAIKIIMKEA